VRYIERGYVNRINKPEITLHANDKIDAKNPQKRQYAKKKLEKMKTRLSQLVCPRKS